MAQKTGEEKRQERINDAVRNGVMTEKLSSPLLPEEHETMIYFGRLDNTAEIDTTERTVMTKCLNRGWEIIAITYYGLENEPIIPYSSICGMRFKGTKNKISISRY